MFYGMFRMWPKHVESFFTKLTEGANIRDLFKRNKEAGVGRGFCEPICILACLILYCAGRDCHVISLVMNISTSCAIRNVAEARDIVCNRRHLFVPDGISAFDTVEKRSKLAEGFNRLTFGAARGIKTMQNCIGAFDGMLLEVDRQIVVPNDRGMRNHKTTKSAVNVQACVDARRRFTMFHVDSSGSTNDALAFSLSPLGRWLQESRPDLGDFWFIGDGGYALDDHVMIPYRQYSCHAGVTADQARGFNIKASSLRSPVECAFGIFKDKWRVFRTPLHFGYFTYCILVHSKQLQLTLVGGI
ncbi:Protein ALP1-like [Hondaea fermentalgiana]|uniref:Protein ALP1-like n=1 Tax=Hondaea fermentalgiana TaxID=2315210 RepID=A0A2R5GWE9_9STRA|nr:Protein ALP1-like [Hondaea fermentalgiana]|eukprot:GBG35166.1 Protein ALP1-like [Hondaea fermentalgiana]